MALIHGIGGILSLGKIWTVPLYSASPRGMEQSKFYLAIILLPFHSEPLNICIPITGQHLDEGAEINKLNMALIVMCVNSAYACRDLN